MGARRVDLHVEADAQLDKRFPAQRRGVLNEIAASMGHLDGGQSWTAKFWKPDRLAAFLRISGNIRRLFLLRVRRCVAAGHAATATILGPAAAVLRLLPILSG